MPVLNALKELLLVVLATAGLPVTRSHDAALAGRLSPLEVDSALEAARADVGPAIALASVHQESRFDPAAKSHTSDFGLFQIHCGSDFSWCRRFGVKPKDLLDPHVNIPIGLTVLRYCKTRADSCRGRDCPHYLFYFNQAGWYVRSVLKRAARYRSLLKPLFPAYDHIS